MKIWGSNPLKVFDRPSRRKIDMRRLKGHHPGHRQMNRPCPVSEQEITSPTTMSATKLAIYIYNYFKIPWFITGCPNEKVPEIMVQTH